MYTFSILEENVAWGRVQTMLFSMEEEGQASPVPHTHSGDQEHNGDMLFYNTHVLGSNVSLQLNVFLL